MKHLYRYSLNLIISIGIIFYAAIVYSGGVVCDESGTCSGAEAFLNIDTAQGINQLQPLYLGTILPPSSQDGRRASITIDIDYNTEDQSTRKSSYITFGGFAGSPSPDSFVRDYGNRAIFELFGVECGVNDCAQAGNAITLDGTATLSCQGCTGSCSSLTVNLDSQGFPSKVGNDVRYYVGGSISGIGSSTCAGQYVGTYGFTFGQ